VLMGGITLYDKPVQCLWLAYSISSAQCKSFQHTVQEERYAIPAYCSLLEMWIGIERATAQETL
jgi:hypothetical protein